jgi:hypothetical protein
MCVDYTSLNNACLKDPFPLPCIDQVVDLTAGCELLILLDAYLGFHQIPLTEVDQPATTFITPFSCFCYIKMSYELKNSDERKTPGGGGYISAMRAFLLQRANRA